MTISKTAICVSDPLLEINHPSRLKSCQHQAVHDIARRLHDLGDMP